MQKLVIGNWKLNFDHFQAISHLQKINYSLTDRIFNNIDLVVAPSHTLLRSIQTVIDTDNLKISCAAQDVSKFEEGSYTGEVGAFQLNKLNISWSIIGHSERRIKFNETDLDINTKLKNLLKNKINPIICIGENLQERNQNLHLEKCLEQVREIFKGIRKDNLGKVAIAYEPIWAVGTGDVAKPEDVDEILKEIRKYLQEKSYELDKFRFIYGGSVNPKNVKDFILNKNIEGFLVGGASLSVDDFVKIIKLSL